MAISVNIGATASGLPITQDLTEPETARPEDATDMRAFRDLEPSMYEKRVRRQHAVV
jgi:hypothetical protein